GGRCFQDNAGGPCIRTLGADRVQGRSPDSQRDQGCEPGHFQHVIGIETNVLVRLLVADSLSRRRRLACLSRRRRGEKISINPFVLAECLWVLASKYGTSKADALAAVERFADSLIPSTVLRRAVPGSSC